jgi:hypothetical protein
MKVVGTIFAILFFFKSLQLFKGLILRHPIRYWLICLEFKLIWIIQLIYYQSEYYQSILTSEQLLFKWSNYMNILLSNWKKVKHRNNATNKYRLRKKISKKKIKDFSPTYSLTMSYFKCFKNIISLKLFKIITLYHRKKSKNLRIHE